MTERSTSSHCSSSQYDDEPVGNGGERELDGEWGEDSEWLEYAGFEVDQGVDPSDRVWRREIASDINLVVCPSGSTSLTWRCRDHSHKRTMHFGIGDNATRREIKQLCECLGKPVKDGSQAKCVTDRGFGGRWCPEVCPITLFPFFMWIEHPDLGWVPTYGGPFDSYTIPEPDMEQTCPRIDLEYYRRRYDHDEGGWRLDEVESVELRVVAEETLIELNAWGDDG